LTGSRLESLRQVSGDRVLELSFAAKAGGFSLVLEMVRARGELLLVGADRRILASLHASRGGPRDLSVGEPYRFPQAKAQPAVLKSITENPWRYLEAGGLSAASATPLHLALGAHYLRQEKEAVLREKKEALSASLRKSLAKRSEVLGKVRDDLARAETGEKLLEKGELLKGAFGSLRRGMSSIELVDYFRPECEKVKIDLNPALSPEENVERYFKRYKKARRAIPFLRERLAKKESEISRLHALLELLQAAGTLEGVSNLEAEARPLLPRVSSGKAKEAREASPRGPRRFLSTGGFEILVGRSAKENDELTFRLARGNDLFLHVSAGPGAHVIIRTVPQKTVPLETLLEAGQLALYYSLPGRSRSLLEVGRSAEIHYTPVKFVRKPKGAKPGMVHLSAHKSLRVRLEGEGLRRMLQGDD
jgi:predicted ribosome quality control (RQC) complex YloA/Tae2 family protein